MLKGIWMNSNPWDLKMILYKIIQDNKTYVTINKTYVTIINVGQEIIGDLYKWSPYCLKVHKNGKFMIWLLEQSIL